MTLIMNCYYCDERHIDRCARCDAPICEDHCTEHGECRYVEEGCALHIPLEVEEALMREEYFQLVDDPRARG